MTLPYVKFWSFTISYFVFLTILILSSIQFASDEHFNIKFSIVYNKYFENYTNYIKNQELTYRFTPRDMYIRKDTPSYIDLIVCVWILGLCLREIKKIYIYGLKEYLSSWNNVLISIMHVLLLCSYALKFFTIAVVKIQKEKIGNPSFWKTVNEMKNDTKAQKMVYETFYWLNEGKNLRKKN